MRPNKNRIELNIFMFHSHTDDKVICLPLLLVTAGDQMLPPDHLNEIDSGVGDPDDGYELNQIPVTS